MAGKQPWLVRQVSRSQTAMASMVSVGRGTALLNIPKVPGRAGHHRFSKKRHYIQVIRKFPVDLVHRIGIGIVPAIKFCLADRMRFLIAAGRGVDASAISSAVALPETQVYRYGLDRKRCILTLRFPR